MADNLIEATRNLPVTVPEIIGQKDEYPSRLCSFEEPMRRAPAELRQAAKLFKQFSEEEEYADPRSHYIIMSEALGGFEATLEMVKPSSRLSEAIFHMEKPPPFETSGAQFPQGSIY